MMAALVETTRGEDVCLAIREISEPIPYRAPLEGERLIWGRQIEPVDASDGSDSSKYSARRIAYISVQNEPSNIVLFKEAN